MKQCIKISIFLWLSLLLSGCISNIWTGATLIYGRHSTYQKLEDFNMNASANRALYRDNVFKQDNISIEVAVFNRDVLMVGSLPTAALRQEAYARVDAATPGKRRFFNQLAIAPHKGNSVQDAWTTGKIRSRIIADAAINPDAFKVITYKHIVYLMGDVIPSQAEKVILFARQTAGVQRVVKLFRYYNLSDRPA